MIQPIVNIEDTAYLGESVRIDCSKSILSEVEGDVTAITVIPDTGLDPIDCTEDGYVDYVYYVTGFKTVTLTVQTATSSATQTFTAVTEVVDPATLNLFSTDTDLSVLEPNLPSYVPQGWSKLTRLHRRAQDTILDTLDEKGILKRDPTTQAVSRYEASDIYDKLEVRTWSIQLALSFLFESLIVQPDDIYAKKAVKYFDGALTRGGLAGIRLKNQDPSNARPLVKNLVSTRLERF